MPVDLKMSLAALLPKRCPTSLLYRQHLSVSSPSTYSKPLLHVAVSLQSPSLIRCVCLLCLIHREKEIFPNIITIQTLYSQNHV